METSMRRVGSRGKPRTGLVIEGHFVGSIAARLHRLLWADTQARGVSNSQLAALLGTSRRTVQYVLRELESAGLVETAYSRQGRYVEPTTSGRATALGVSPLAGTTLPVRPRRRTRAAR
jgi:DNA-binding transcriptional ArsR family regulator